MKWFSYSKRSPIGIDIGSRLIKALQLHRVGGSWRVLATAVVPRTDDQAIIGLQELTNFVGVLERQGFVGRDVVLATPESMLLGGMLELPPRDSGAPFDQIAQIEFARMHKRQPEAFKMTSWDLPTSARRTGAMQVMAVGCDHTDAEHLLDLFEELNLNVLALDTAAWSLVRACQSLFQNGTEVGGILDLGWNSARLVVLYEGVIIYERSISEGGMNALYASLSDRMGVDSNVVAHLIEEVCIAGSRSTDLPGNVELEAAIESYLELIVELIQGSFSYATHRYRDATRHRLLLVGGGATVVGLLPRLQETVNSDVSATVLSQLIGFPNRHKPTQDNAALTMALGLAKHGLGAEL